MTHVLGLRRAALLSGLLIGVLGSACGSPTSPTPRPTSTGPAAAPPGPPPSPPTFERYRVAGVFTDESGAPLAGLPVWVDYRHCASATYAHSLPGSERPGESHRWCPSRATEPRLHRDADRKRAGSLRRDDVVALAGLARM